MIVPQDFLEEVTALVPPPTRTTKATPTPTPLPTVKPDPIPLIFTEGATDTGRQTIWLVVFTPSPYRPANLPARTDRVVCVLMGISSLAFYYLAARVPVVSGNLGLHGQPGAMGIQ